MQNSDSAALSLNPTTTPRGSMIGNAPVFTHTHTHTCVSNPSWGHLHKCHLLVRINISSHSPIQTHNWKNRTRWNLLSVELIRRLFSLQTAALSPSLLSFFFPWTSVSHKMIDWGKYRCEEELQRGVNPPPAPYRFMASLFTLTRCNAVSQQSVKYSWLSVYRFVFRYMKNNMAVHLKRL